MLAALGGLLSGITAQQNQLEKIEEIISLTGGNTRKDEDSRPWDDHTLVPIWSATKGPAAATLLLALAKR